MSTVNITEINVEHLMQRIKQSLTGRINTDTTLASSHASSDASDCDLAELASALSRIATDVNPPARSHLSLSAPVNTSGRTPLRSDGQHGYHVRDFLPYDGVEFVSNAYQALLRREVDNDGLSCYLTMLRDGASKVEILGRIAGSSEAKQHSGRVRGLTIAYFLDTASRWPLIGRVVGIAVAIWNLPAMERRARRLSSELAYRLCEVEQDTMRARQGIYQALGVLEHSQNQLADFTCSLTSRAHVDALQRVLAQVIGALRALELNNASKLGQNAFELGISELRGEIDRKADQGSLADLHLQVQSASAAKAEGRDLERSLRDIGALRTEVERLAESLGTLQACKADATAVENINQSLLRLQVQSASAAKAEGRDLERSLRDIGALRTEVERLAESLGALQACKADAAAVENTNHSLLRALETKSERHEATALANHLITLVQQRATKDDLQTLASAVSQASDSIAAVSRRKADTRDLYALRSALENEARAGFDGVNLTLQGFARTKADHASIATLRDEVTAALGAAIQGSEKSWRESLSDLAQRLESLRVNVSSHVGADMLKTEIVNNVEGARAQLNEILDKLAEAKADRVLVEELRAELRDTMASLRRSASESLDKALGPLNLRAEDLRRQVLDQDRRVGLLLEEARKRFPRPVSAGQISAMLSEDDHRFDAMYARFEDQFRGTRADIRQKQTIYIPYVRNSKAGTANAPVIDIGCGRGEWLEVLRDEGLVAKGVDLNRVMLDGCRELNLEVCEQDAIAHLRELKPSSVGAVTSFHMIEHLNHRTLIALLDEALRVLRPGGVMILETPNPSNLVVGSCNFYLDPTHQRPLPPDLSRYLLEARGFTRVEVKELHSHGPEHWIAEGAPAVRDALNRILHSAQDYAVIGWKA
jgi:SAM-dependent methyltransferase